MSGMPDLLPSASAQTAPVNAQAMGNGLGFDSPQMRIVQRAPNLGQIGRSKKVVIEDEDVDVIMNNNGQFAVFFNLSPVA